MAHFCKFCGAKLEDGQVCTCKASVMAAQEAASSVQQPIQQPAPQFVGQQMPQQPMQQQTQMPMQQMPQQQYVPQQPQYAAQNTAPSAFSRWIANIKRFIKSPATVAREQVRNRAFKPALIFMGIVSVLMGFIVLIIDSKINGLLDAIGSMSRLIGGKSNGINLFGAFFGEAILTFGILCAFAAFLMLFARIFKCHMSYTHALAATGIASAVAIPFLVLGIIAAATISSIISFSLILLGLLILGAQIAGLFITVEAIKDDQYLTNNNAVYVVFLALAATIVCVMIVSLIKNFKTFSELNDLSSRLSGLGGLMGGF